MTIAGTSPKRSISLSSSIQIKQKLRANETYEQRRTRMFSGQQDIAEVDGSVQFTRQHTAVSVASPKANSRPQTAKMSQKARLTFKDAPVEGIKFQSY